MYHHLTPLGPIDYLLVGHLTRDIALDGPRLGGTAAYAGLTAHALGLRVGIVTSWAADLPLGSLRDIPIISLASEESTTFENIYAEDGRRQHIRHVAQHLDLNLIPDAWRNPSIVHIAPVAQEISPTLVRHFSNALIGLTPQGWLRTWNEEGLVSPCEWPEASFVLGQGGATVLSLEDVADDEERIEEMAASCRVLAVTEAERGSRLYWNGDVRRFPAQQVSEVDSTGAGDVYAAAFFFRLFTTRDPWEAARFATQLATISVTRPGLLGVPTTEEIQESMVEVY